MDKLAQNSFSNGLALDNSPFVQVNSTLKNCLNGTILTFKGNEYVLQNDLGNGKVGLKDKEGNIEYVKLSKGFVPLGVKEHGGIIYIVSKNPKTNQEEIGSFPSPEYDTPLNTITLTDSNTIDYNSDYTEKIFKTTAINVGDVINFSYESDSSSSPTINIWDLSNVKDKDKNEPNRMVNFQIIFNSKESNNVDRTEELFNRNVIKTDGNVFNEDGYNTTLEDHIIKERNTKITLKVTPSKIYSLSSGSGGYVKDNKLYLQQDYLLFKYDCPDGDTNYEYQNSTGREVNYFHKIEGWKNEENDENKLLDFLNEPVINKKEKIYTRLYTIKSDKISNFENNDKLKVKVTGIKRENGNEEKFITYNSEFLDLITNNIQLFTYNADDELSQYKRFVWNKITLPTIWGKDANPYNDNEINYNHYNLNTKCPIKIWYVAPFQSKIAIFNISTPEPYGRVLDNRQVGQAVKKSQNIQNAPLLYRSIYEFSGSTDDYYLVIAFDINNDSLEIKDVEYFFPQKSVYKDNTIPCSITYDINTHSDDLKPDGFGNKNGYSSDNYEGQNEITHNKPIYIFGRQLTDSGRDFKLNLTKNCKLKGLLLTTAQLQYEPSYIYQCELNCPYDKDYSGSNIYLDITNLQFNKNSVKFTYGNLYEKTENSGPTISTQYSLVNTKHDQWTIKQYKENICKKIGNNIEFDTNDYNNYFSLNNSNVLQNSYFNIKVDNSGELEVKDNTFYYINDDEWFYQNSINISVIDKCISKLNVYRIKDCTLSIENGSIIYKYTPPLNNNTIKENSNISEHFINLFNNQLTCDLLVIDIIKQDGIVNYLGNSGNDILVIIRKNDGNNISIFYPDLGKNSNGNNKRVEEIIPDFKNYYLKNTENEDQLVTKKLFNYNTQSNNFSQYFNFSNLNKVLYNKNQTQSIYNSDTNSDSVISNFISISNIQNSIKNIINLPSNNSKSENMLIYVNDFQLKWEVSGAKWNYATFDGNTTENPNFFEGYGNNNIKIYQYNNGEKLFILPKNNKYKVIECNNGGSIRVDFNDFEYDSTGYYFKTDKFVIFCNENINSGNSYNYKKDTLTLNCTPNYISTNIKPNPDDSTSKYFVL